MWTDHYLLRNLSSDITLCSSTATTLADYTFENRIVVVLNQGGDEGDSVVLSDESAAF
jgi:hypothetical protein